VELVGRLVGLVLSEHGDGLLVDGDGTGPVALGGPVDPLARDHGGRARDGDLLAVETAVGPAQVEHFATPGTGVGGDVEKGEQPVLAGRGQERRSRQSLVIVDGRTA